MKKYKKLSVAGIVLYSCGYIVYVLYQNHAAHHRVIRLLNGDQSINITRSLIASPNYCLDIRDDIDCKYLTASFKSAIHRGAVSHVDMRSHALRLVLYTDSGSLQASYVWIGRVGEEYGIEFSIPESDINFDESDYYWIPLRRPFPRNIELLIQHCFDADRQQE
jgi:hypothetical protein